MASFFISNDYSNKIIKSNNYYISFDNIINRFGGTGKTYFGLDSNLKFRIKNEIKIIEIAQRDGSFLLNNSYSYHSHKIVIEPVEIKILKLPCITVHEKKILIEINKISPEIDFMKKLNTNFDFDWLTNLSLTINFWIYDGYNNLINKVTLYDCEVTTFLIDTFNLESNNELSRTLVLQPKQVLREE